MQIYIKEEEKKKIKKKMLMVMYRIKELILNRDEGCLKRFILPFFTLLKTCVSSVCAYQRINSKGN